MLMQFLRRVLLLLPLVLLASPARGEETVAEVKVEGNRKIEKSVILNAVGSKAGEAVSPDKVDADIRAVYRLGYFRDVWVTSDKAPAGGVVLTVHVTEMPVVKELKIEGNKEFNADKVKEKILLKQNTLFNPKDLAQSIRNVKKMYTDEGYYLVEVKGETERISDTEVKGVFTITEGEKILISRIRFEGNRAYDDKKLKKTMETKESWFLSWLTGAGTHKEDVLKNDVALLSDLYLNSGYINVKIGEPRVELLPDKSGLEVTIPVSEGEQYRIGSIGFKGDLLETADYFRAKMKVKGGDLFNRGAVRTDILALTDIYADRGYAFANVSPLTKLDAAAKTVDLTFDVEKGEKVFIERINVGGNQRTRDKVIRRELNLAEGDQYSSTAIKKSKQKLMNLGFFEDVSLTTPLGTKADRVNMNVEVKEKATGTFSIGAGYSSLDGLIGQGSVQQANFLGLGLKAHASASLGGKSQTYNLGITDPWFMDTRWTLGGDIYRTEREFTNFKRRLTGADIKAGHPIGDDVSTFFIYRFEKKDLFDIVGTEDEDLEPHTITSAIQGSITRNTTDYRLDPTRGTVSNFSTEFAGLGGNNRFVRYSLDSTLFVPVIWGTVFSVKGTLGYVQDIGKTIPRDEKFMPGGIGSIRGYAPRSVGPVVVNRIAPAEGLADARRFDFKGGDTQALLNVEYVFPLLKEAGVKGVLFFDAGGAFGIKDFKLANEDNQAFKAGQLQAGYGFGIRWFSPIGPLRLEYGIPVNPRSVFVGAAGEDGKRKRINIDEPGGRLEFSIGSTF